MLKDFSVRVVRVCLVIPKAEKKLNMLNRTGVHVVQFGYNLLKNNSEDSQNKTRS